MLWAPATIQAGREKLAQGCSDPVLIPVFSSCGLPEVPFLNAGVLAYNLSRDQPGESDDSFAPSLAGNEVSGAGSALGASSVRSSCPAHWGAAVVNNGG